jgi:hypothetical protein
MNENYLHTMPESLARPVTHMSPFQQTCNTSKLQHPTLPPKEAYGTASDAALRSPTAPQAVKTAIVEAAEHTEGGEYMADPASAPCLQQVQNNVEMRHPEWSQQQIQKTAFVKILAKQRANATTAATGVSSNHEHGNIDAVGFSLDGAQGHQQSQVGNRQGNDDSQLLPLSCSMSPSDALSSLDTPTSTSIAGSSIAAFVSVFAPEKRPPPSPPKAPAPKRRGTPLKTLLKQKEPAHRVRRKEPKSEAIVVDSDDSDNDMKGSNSTGPSEVPVVDWIDPSEGLSGWENRDENGDYVKKPHARLLLKNGIPTKALVVKLKVSPNKLQETLDRIRKNVKRKAERGLSTPFTNGELFHQAPNGALARGSTSRYTHGGFNSSLSTPRLTLSLSATRLNPSPSAPRPVPDMASNHEDAAWESDTDVETPNMTPPPPEVTFPGLPSLSAAHLPLFMKGLTIAIENIITDHADKPDDTLLELVEQLEEEKPTLPAGTDDRRIVLSGGEYVYAAVHQICADAVPASDTAKDSGVDADGDTNMASPPSDGVDDVKLTDRVDGITALMEKAQYKGKGRAWKKTPNDADPAFRAQSKTSVSHLPKRVLGRRKAARKGAWKEHGIRELFEAFCAHVKREYWFQAGHLGIKPDKDVLPKWLWEQ